MNTYKLLDSGNFMKLEQVGPYRVARPALSAVWDPSLSKSEWADVDATFKRHKDGNGEWIVKNDEIKKPWEISIEEITFRLKLTGFGHLGIFAEQQSNWQQLQGIIREANRKPMRVLNLFAYTGGSTLFAASAGAEVVHLDASKSAVGWARDNAALSKLSNAPVRWIVDDVQDFVAKELRRGSQYEGIILDPPSYGRGQKNQVWKIEDHLMPLLKNLKKLTSPNFSFVLLSSHSTGYTPFSLENQLRQVFGPLWPADEIRIHSEEMFLTDDQGKRLPSGAYSLLVRK